MQIIGRNYPIMVWHNKCKLIVCWLKSSVFVLEYIFACENRWGVTNVCDVYCLEVIIYTKIV